MFDIKDSHFGKSFAFIKGGVEKCDFIFIRELNCMVDSVNPSRELDEIIFCSNLNNKNAIDKTFPD